MKVTAETITDKQIRELMDWAWDTRGKARLVKSCMVALFGAETKDLRRGETRVVARERCAVAWNARHRREGKVTQTRGPAAPSPPVKPSKTTQVVTADTISDAQIREWEGDVIEYGSEFEKREAIDLATWALTLPSPNHHAIELRRIARIGVAAVWNARYGGKDARERGANAEDAREGVTVTADTISDTQLREIAKWGLDEGARVVAALRVPNGRREIAARRAAREWCADAWNMHQRSLPSTGPEREADIDVALADPSTHEPIAGAGDYGPTNPPPGVQKARRLPPADEQSLDQSEDDEP